MCKDNELADEVIRLQAALNASELMRASAGRAYAEEISEDTSHQRMQKAIEEAVELKKRLDIAMCGFNEIIMNSSVEGRQWNGWTEAQQVAHLREIASDYEKRISDYRTTGKLIQDIREGAGA